MQHMVHCAFFLASLSSSFAASQDTKVIRSRVADQTQISLTVYSNGRSTIRDRRKLSLDKGRQHLELEDVSGQMRAETAQLKTLGGSGDIVVLEQNLEFDLLSPQKLLEKFLGRTVSVIRVHPTTGTESAESAEVLAVQNGVVLKMKDRIETGMPGRISFPEVPKSLRAEPTLSVLMESKKRGEQEIELLYQTDGISWKADYIAELNQNEQSAHLTGLVTLTNQSGTSFRNAQLQLMGGDIRTVGSQNVRRSRMVSFEAPMAAMDSAPEDASMSSQAFFEYHLYTLPRPTSVLSNQVKQVTLLQAPSVKARKELLFTSSANYVSATDDFDGDADAGADDSADSADLGTPLTGDVFLVLENDKDANLGMPMPAGTVRVYKKDKDGSAQFIGEDNIRHVPEGERVRVKLGRSFDVSARRKLISFKFLPPSSSMKKIVRTSESNVRIVFKNAKDSAQKVLHREVFPGEWKILNPNHEFKKLSKDTAEWQISVPAKGTLSLDFRAQVTVRR